MSNSKEFQDAMNKFKNMKMPPGGPGAPAVPSKKSILIFFFVILGLAFYQTTFYTVQPDEEAVVLRLGRYLETKQPGLHYKLPFGVDRMFIVKTKLIHQEEFGFRTQQVRGSRTSYSGSNYQRESLMLTGDLNVADVEWVVQYQIADPYKYIFKAKDPRRNIRDVSESMIRRVVGDKNVTEVLTTGRAEIASSAALLMQGVLDKYDIGVKIVSIKLQDVNPPEEVKASFNEVNEAKQEQEKLINIAEKKYNEVIPEARGKADETISTAEGYAQAIVDRAAGDASKFLSVYRAYSKAPAITKKRIYIETMEGLFGGFDSLTIVDSKIKGLLPVFENPSVKK